MLSAILEAEFECMGFKYPRVRVNKILKWWKSYVQSMSISLHTWNMHETWDNWWTLHSKPAFDIVSGYGFYRLYMVIPCGATMVRRTTTLQKYIFLSWLKSFAVKFETIMIFHIFPPIFYYTSQDSYVFNVNSSTTAQTKEETQQVFKYLLFWSETA